MTDVSSPLIAPREDSTTAFSGVFIAEDIDSLMASYAGGGWIDVAIGGVAVSMDALAFVTDPLGQLVAWGVGWLIEHVKPLSDALDELAGDPDQIAAYAQTWRNLTTTLTDAATTFEDAVGRQVADWKGAAAAAYRQHSGEHAAILAALGRATHALAEITTGAGLLVAMVRALVRDLIAEFVSVLAVRLWEWLAEAGVTLGLATPWVITQVTTLAGKWAARIARLLHALIGSLRRLSPILQRLGDLVADLRTLLRRVTHHGATSPSAPSRDTHLLHADADPLRKWGPARQTHPGEWEAAIRDAQETGVEVSFREGALAYGPSPSPGRPGHLVLDPDASYGALLHEMQHLRDDHAAGWAGMRGWFEDPVVRYENEVRAYQQEIRYAESIGDRESVERLNEAIREEYVKIFGVEP
ncbi:WXG100 family type VII secretion target [Micromonospora sp. WMMC415]|uniref:WXG100-like domain-containing protein n=1 Tax=Micromonospora sp. WMMC415 TaxID=2675222 RepID=UPI0012B469FD|nr:WXG100 family type VII secretion target [Micromonospora sp. WMMC415]QGN48443.1 WXG100 family type VII secretion target [Micromonospora sp. WMMC415]